MLAWKVAGYYGLDRFLLPLLGTPWRQVVTQPLAAQAQAPATTATPIAR
jgi:thiosulfate dehydrogenase [quinone] large subunit